MIILHKVLENITKEIDLHSIKQFGYGVFFVMLNDQLIMWRTLGVQGSKHSDLKFSSEQLNDPQAQIAKVCFFPPFLDERKNEVHLGVYRTLTSLAQMSSSQANHLHDTDEAFLQGVKQGILFSLKVEQECSKNKTLFEMTKKIHSSMEVDQVLQMTYHTVQELYVNYETYICLSQDYHGSLPVKKLDFRQEETDINCQALMRGETLIYQHQNKVGISSPLRGNQGSYGVLQLIHSISKKDLEKESAHISILAEMVGTALENAKLYQHSKSLINQLQLINEASEQLSKTLNLEQNIDFMLSKVMETFSPDGVHFLSYIKGQNEYSMVQTTTSHLQDKTFMIKNHQFLREIHDSKESFIATDAEKQDDGIFGCVCDLTYRSLMIVPMVHNSQMEGMIILTHSQPDHFSYDNLRLLETLVHHASFAFVNSSLHQEVNRMVITDNLTRLFARSYLDQELSVSQNKDLSGSFILIDIDNFKAVNDTYGHQVGDDILIQVSNVMKTSIRDTDVAARWGGEELAIYLPNVPLEKAIDIAGRIRERVSHETSPSITISCGISYWEQQDKVKSMATLFQKADQCLYKAKNAGKNQVVFYQESIS
jgi:two-component system cell cycle response regulator